MNIRIQSLRCVIGAVAACCATFSSFAQDISNPEFYNKFAFKLCNTIANMEEDNVAFSPISAEIALGIMRNDAQGEALREIDEVLGTEMYTAEEINTFNQNMLNALSKIEMTESDWGCYAYNTLKGPRLNVSNFIFNNVDHRARQDFYQLYAKYYQFAFYALYFKKQKDEIRDIINFWLNDQSDGYLPSVDATIAEDAAMYFVSSLYFQGRWYAPFVEILDVEGVFTNQDNTKVPIEYMNLNKKFTIAKSDAFDMIKLYFTPYSSKRLSMSLYLPRNNDVSFTFEEYTKLQNSKYEDFTRVYLPAFSIDSRLSFKDVFEEMGIKGIFTPNNEDLKSLWIYDFEDVYINDIIHPCKVAIDRYGIGAPGSSFVGIPALETDWENETFSFDRPFYYTIEDNENNLILMMGRVNKLGGKKNSDSNEVSSIIAPEIEENNAATYDLAGRRVNGASQQGIVIKNGRKILR